LIKVLLYQYDIFISNYPAAGVHQVKEGETPQKGIKKTCPYPEPLVGRLSLKFGLIHRPYLGIFAHCRHQPERRLSIYCEKLFQGLRGRCG
jgi:hypothetical protein